MGDTAVAVVRCEQPVEGFSIMHVLANYARRLKGEGKEAPQWLTLSPDSLASLVLSAIAILVLCFIQYFGYVEHHLALVAVIPAFGATCALVYGATQVHASQPRAVVVGYVLSAIVGVVCQLIFRNASAQPISTRLGAALAVGISLGLMKMTSTIHPPACACAVVAALTPPNLQVRDQGFLFVVTPVLLGCVVLLSVAWVGNNAVTSRKHYPTIW